MCSIWGSYLLHKGFLKCAPPSKLPPSLASQLWPPSFWPPRWAVYRPRSYHLGLPAWPPSCGLPAFGLPGGLCIALEATSLASQLWPPSLWPPTWGVLRPRNYQRGLPAWPPSLGLPACGEIDQI